MTSKEDLKMIKIKCHPNANPNPMIDEALNNIEKDLEVLEILKEYLTPHILEELCIEEKEVWEWLGNDK